LAPVYVDLVASTPSETGGLAPVPDPELNEGPHLSYTLQWWFFSLCVVVGWVIAVRRSVGQRRTDASAAVSASAGSPGRVAGAVSRRNTGAPARSALAAADARRSLYLDLTAYLANQDNGGTPFTQSVQTFYALDEALAEFFDEGGWTARQSCYRARQALIRQTLAALGVAPLLDPAASSCVLQAFRLPAGLSYEALHDGLKARGFVIYAGQGKLAAGIFRISAMGTITDGDLARLQAALTAEIGR
jgi:2-aminoethylphosphonate-pyruvate transaminase